MSMEIKVERQFKMNYLEKKSAMAYELALIQGLDL
jgi:hypothetical protein